jgi:hypothetical protein
MNVEAIQKLPETVQDKIYKNPTNTKVESETDKIGCWIIDYKYEKLPKQFDGRKIWPGLNNTIFNQGKCGSCWAFATCGLLSDRYYVLSKGKVNVTLSPTRLLLCDIEGQDIEYAYNGKSDEKIKDAIRRIIQSRENKNSSCYGNTIQNALLYLFIYGTCTTECLPYEYDYKSKITNLFSPLFSNLPHDTKTRVSIGKSDRHTFKSPISDLDYIKNTVTGLPPENSPWTDYNLTKFNSTNYVPSCGEIMSGTGDMCLNWNHSIVNDMIFQGTPARFYRLGLWYAVKRKNLYETNIAIQQDIFKWGPVVSVIKIYENFYDFDPKTEIYKWNKKGEQLAAHAIEIVGWGAYKNNDFWIVKNSWGRNWGDNGYFRILKGFDECGIETNVMAGLPDFFTPIIGGGETLNSISDGLKNIYNVKILQQKNVNDKWNINEINPLQIYKNRDLAAIERIGLDISIFNGRINKGFGPYLDFLHNFTGGIDAYTGFTRRAMLMHSGLDFTPPVKISDVNFSEKFYAGKQKIREIVNLNKPNTMLYIFYFTIVIFLITIIFLTIHKYKA